MMSYLECEQSVQVEFCYERFSWSQCPFFWLHLEQKSLINLLLHVDAYCGQA